MNPDDEEHFDDLEYEDDEEDPWDWHDYEGESPESLRNWYNGRVLWVSTYDEFDYEIHISTQDRVDSHTIAIASVGVGYCGPIESEQQANASLIAAAPDLLEALRDCLGRFIEAFPASAEYEPIKRGFAAIAKAEGRS